MSNSMKQTYIQPDLRLVSIEVRKVLCESITVGSQGRAGGEETLGDGENF